MLDGAAGCKLERRNRLAAGGPEGRQRRIHLPLGYVNTARETASREATRLAATSTIIVEAVASASA